MWKEGLGCWCALLPLESAPASAHSSPQSSLKLLLLPSSLLWPGIWAQLGLMAADCKIRVGPEKDWAIVVALCFSFPSAMSHLLSSAPSWQTLMATILITLHSSSDLVLQNCCRTYSCYVGFSITTESFLITLYCLILYDSPFHLRPAYCKFSHPWSLLVVLVDRSRETQRACIYLFRPF